MCVVHSVVLGREVEAMLVLRLSPLRALARSTWSFQRTTRSHERLLRRALRQLGLRHTTATPLFSIRSQPTELRIVIRGLR